MHKFVVPIALLAATAVAGTAKADPSHNIQQPLTLTCDNKEAVVVNPGTVTNHSHQAFVVGSTSVLVAKFLSFSDSTGEFVFFDTAPGLSQDLVTCTGDAGGGFAITVRGFFTPPA